MSWELLRRIKDICTLPWCVAGDFNAMLYMHEKVGGGRNDYDFIRDFRNIASDCDLADLGCIGEQMTWINGQGDGDMIMERLDHAL